MKLYLYKSYDEYVESQIKTNKEKLGRVWASDQSMMLVAKYVKKNIPNYSFGICHGVRNGWEVNRLRELLNVEVIGTDISPTAVNFPNVIEWDFHNIKPKWLNAVDFIYSNSFDHSYNPEECLDKWMSCIKHSGCCFIEWSENHIAGGSVADCFGATLDEYKEIISRKYCVEKVILSRRSNKKMQGHIIVIKHK